MKAIETHYAGCRFRSRLEARWAVFFDHLRIHWEYEPQGFTVDGRGYLPDFLLPTCGTWVEVKGAETDLNVDLMVAATHALPGLPVSGEPGPRLMILGPIPRPLTTGDYGWVGLDPIVGTDLVDISRYGFGTYHKNRRPWWLDMETLDGPLLEPTVDPYEWPDAQRAYTAARSARFEHGEMGAVPA